MAADPAKRLRSTSPAPRSAREGRARQQRGVRTEHAIIDATVTLLATRGIHGTSLDAVAEAVGVAKSSILWHFGSKEGLLLRVAEEVFEAVAKGRVQEILALESFEARLEATWRMFAETVRDAPALRRLVLHLIFESVEGRPELRERLQHLYRGMRELFEAGLRGVLPDPAQRKRASVIAVATFDGVFLQWLLDPDAVDISALHGDVTDLYTRAGLIGGQR
jgi:AcrR family transcriptional regulator